ncbi:MAG: hypothetical protein JWL97_3563, partial [Gemmatimonadales bacterium]|nr:hypothetical protein [Gemmatimonadales bacterium]
MIVTVLAVEIDLEAGWAVGATDTVLTGVDRELLTDREGNPWVPASSLAGSLRAHLAAHGSDERLMGSRPPEGRADTSLTPSALWLVGTSTTDAENHDPPPTDVVANT